MNVVSIRYFETRRGVGYEALTDFGGTIWNDGDGGGTYIVPTDYRLITNGELHNLLPKQYQSGFDYEMFLESLINKYENV